MQIELGSDYQDEPLFRATSGFSLGPGVVRAVSCRAHQRRRDEPLWRRLRIFSRDPSESRLAGKVTTVRVPYEPLEPGPTGRNFEVDSTDLSKDVRYRRIDLDHPHVLLTDGREPSQGDPLFQQQMVYAVACQVYESFRRSLGRDPQWGFRRRTAPGRLRLYPHAGEMANAHYDGGEGAVYFGYYPADSRSRGRNLPSGTVFTCLSHDIIVHELTHALLDGLRSRFNQPSNGDVAAFHEGFADMMAVFHHFGHRVVLENALREEQGRLTSEILVDLARQFGQTTHQKGAKTALRSAIDDEEDGTIRTYDRELPAHELGSVLTGAIFEAFRTVYRRKVSRLLEVARLPGVAPEDQRLSPTLVDLLAEQASKIAGHFQSICIRAVDYCPPVDIRLGEYLRAMITADYDLVPNDPWAYREALVDAFRKRKIDPPGVRNLSEDELLWQPPERAVGPIEGLAFADLQFDGDPGRPMSAEELTRRARILGRFVTQPQHLAIFGLAPPSTADGIDYPCVESIRTNRRVGPDGDVGFDLVAEVTQKRLVDQDGRRFLFFGGSTIILGPHGEVRYAITKRIDKKERIDEQADFVAEDAGRRLWTESDGMLKPRPGFFRLLDEGLESGKGQESGGAAQPVS